jgi:hypothetical protein
MAQLRQNSNLEKKGRKERGGERKKAREREEREG